MRWHWRTALIGLPLPLVLACWTPPANVGPPAEAIVCAWDISTSMDPGLAEAGREVCVQAVEGLERGWISVRIIGAGSFSSLAEAARLEVLPTPACTNPFSARCRAARTHSWASTASRRREVIDRIRSFRPGRDITGATDIEGALAAIEDALAAVSDTTWRRRAILATDLVASGGSEPVALDLSDLDLLDVWVQWPGNAVKGRALRDAFTTRVRDAGVSNVNYHSLLPMER